MGPYNSLRERLFGPRQRLAETFQQPIQRIPVMDPPLASSQVRALPPLHKTPTGAPNLQPAVLSAALAQAAAGLQNTANSGQPDQLLSTAEPAQPAQPAGLQSAPTSGSTEPVPPQFSADGAESLARQIAPPKVTTPPGVQSAPPKVTKPPGVQSVVQTRTQKKDGSEKAHEQNSALLTLLDQAIQQNKTKEDFKEGDVMPEFLVVYSNTLLARANSHSPPDELCENLRPFLQCDSHGLYTLHQSSLTNEILNLVHTLYLFEKSSPSTPSKLSTWLGTFAAKARSKSTS